MQNADTNRPEIALRTRLARADDAGEISRLAKQLGYDVGPEDALRRWSTLSERADDALWVACDARERVLGWLHVQRARSLLDAPHAEVHALVVDEHARGLGIGVALLACARHWALERGLPRLRVRSRDTRERAHAFYAREGFTITKRQLVFERAC